MEDLDDHERSEPKLNDYYEPSDEMKMYMNVVTGVVGSVSGVVVTKMLFLNRVRKIREYRYRQRRRVKFS